MRIVRKEDIAKPFFAPLGERIYELIGSPLELGRTVHHSLVHVVLPPGKSSPAHYHKVSEETYYVLSGRAHMIINGSKFELLPRQACLIMPGETHQIFNDQDVDLEFLAVSAPAWTPKDSYERKGGKDG